MLISRDLICFLAKTQILLCWLFMDGYLGLMAELGHSNAAHPIKIMTYESKGGGQFKLRCFVIRTQFAVG